MCVPVHVHTYGNAMLISYVFFTCHPVYLLKQGSLFKPSSFKFQHPLRTKSCHLTVECSKAGHEEVSWN